MHSTSNNVTIAGLDGSTSYNGILGSSINGTYTSISNVTLDSYDIQVPGSTNATLQEILVVLCNSNTK